MTVDQSSRASVSRAKTVKRVDKSVRKKTRPKAIEHQSGKPDWKKVRQDASEAKVKRKSKNAMYAVGQDMKRMWEELRVEKCTPERRQQLVDLLWQRVSGRVFQVVRSHDMSRVCETLFELGGPTMQQRLLDEVRDHLVAISRDKYARHFLLCVLSYGSDQHKQLIGAIFRGSVASSAGHKFAADVLETYYRDCASADARKRMLMEFYGSEFCVLSYQPQTLCELVSERPVKRSIYLANVRSQLQVLIDKQMLNSSLSHRVLREYMELCPQSERAELVVCLRELLANIVHTKDGARVACLCVWWGNSKDRKVIVKSFKSYMVKISTDPHGFLVVLVLLDCVDDTRLMSKTVLDELIADVTGVLSDEHGRKVIEFVLTGRSTQYLHPSLVTAISEGDAVSTSRKEPAVRRHELVAAVSERLLRSASLHCTDWLLDSSMCVVLTCVLNHCHGEAARPCFEQLCRMAAAPLSSNVSGGGGDHVIDNAAAYMQLKKMVQTDRLREQEPLFSSVLLAELSDELLADWLNNNRATFLLVIMLETQVQSVVQKLVERIGPLIKKFKPSNKGGEILKAKIKSAVAATKQL